MRLHDKTAFQFSGGRDSLAALYVLKDVWGQLTVYHLDTGDQFPETKSVVDRVEAIVPRFVRVAGNRDAVWRRFGMPTDLLPSTHTLLGKMGGNGGIQLIDRFMCCFHSVMKPMHERMVADGITMIIRGHKNSDYSPPVMSGEQMAGFTFYYPIADWSVEQVMTYLKEQGVEPAPFYTFGMKTTPECMNCTAWWDDGRGAYLKKHHKKEFDVYHDNLNKIKSAIGTQLANLEIELRH